MLTTVLKRLLLSLSLVGAAALILLLSDLHSREGPAGEPPGTGQKRQVALLKHSSNALLDEIGAGRAGATGGGGLSGWRAAGPAAL